MKIILPFSLSLASHINYNRYLLIGSLLLFALSSCSSIQKSSHSIHHTYFYHASPEVLKCLELYDTLDKSIIESQSTDAQYRRMPGFPFLKTSRFLASTLNKLSNQPSTHPENLQAWQDWLTASNSIAIESLIIENLSVESLTTSFSNEPVSQQSLIHCGNKLITQLTQSNSLDWQTEIKRLSQVPPHYQSWKRVLGFYPLLAYPFKQGVKNELVVTTQREENYAPENSSIVLYSFESKLANATRAVRDSFIEPMSIKTNDAGIPIIESALEDQLLAQHSPNVAVSHPQASHNLIGSLMRDENHQLTLNTQQPSLYTWLDYGYFNDAPTIRLNYSFWFTERPKKNRWDLLGGTLDGLIWRVHLDLNGQPIAWDSIHNCGCWYRIHPAQDYEIKSKARSFFDEPFYVGPSLSPDNTNKALLLENDTHHIITVKSHFENITTIKNILGTQQPYLSLKALPLQASPDTSLKYEKTFDQNGLIPDSQRLERFIFWPMGVLSAGAMRVAGTHAISFIGQRHFDDPFLLNDLGLQKTTPSNGE